MGVAVSHCITWFQTQLIQSLVYGESQDRWFQKVQKQHAVWTTRYRAGAAWPPQVIMAHVSSQVWPPRAVVMACKDAANDAMEVKWVPKSVEAAPRDVRTDRRFAQEMR